MYRRHLNGGDETSVRRVLAGASIYLDDLRRVGLDLKDVRVFRRCGVPKRRLLGEPPASADCIPEASP
jgi:hypothetical protein